MHITINCDMFNSRSRQSEIINQLADNMFETYKNTWLNIVNANPGRNCGNKLRKNLHFKKDFNTETYVDMNINITRSALAKFR